MGANVHEKVVEEPTSPFCSLSIKVTSHQANYVLLITKRPWDSTETELKWRHWRVTQECKCQEMKLTGRGFTTMLSPTNQEELLRARKTSFVNIDSLHTLNNWILQTWVLRCSFRSEIFIKRIIMEIQGYDEGCDQFWLFYYV